MTAEGNGAAAENANSLSALLARVETALVAVSAVAMMAIMCIVALDVVLRYGFSAPLSWSYDLIGLYLVGAVVFLSLSDTLHNHGHIALDIFVPLLPDRLRHVSQGLGYAAATVITAIIAWLAAVEGWTAFVAGNRLAAVVAFPTWVADALLAVGMVMLTLRCGYRAAFHIASAWTGRDLVELPPQPETQAREGEHGE